MVDMLHRHGAPRFVTNAHVPGTPAWVEADLRFLDHRLVIEIDGGKWHGTPFRRELDAHKRKLITDARFGVLVLAEEDVAPNAEDQTMRAVWRALSLRPGSHL